MASKSHEISVIHVVSTTISMICQTLIYGVYVSLIPFSTYILLKKKNMTGGNKLMFSVTIFMFSLSTAYWISSLGHLLAIIAVFVSQPSERATAWFAMFPFFNALLLINFVLTDGVVVWRAWILCQYSSRKLLLFPLIFLACTSLTFAATIVIRALMSFNAQKYGGNHKLIRSLDVTQVTNLAVSLLTNIGATSIITFRAWQHHHEVRETVSGNKTATKVERVLVLLVESGFIYCVSGLSVLLASVIRLPHGTLGDIYVPIHVQIAGIYPTVILVLVSQKRSLKEGVFSTVGNTTANAPSRVEAMDFCPNPTLETSTARCDEELYCNNDDYHGASRS